METKERELQEKCIGAAIQLVNVTGEVDTSSLSKAMSQIGLKYTKITNLKKHIEELEEQKEKEEQRREEIHKKCQEMT